MIMEYIKPEESIILNVLSASVDFTTCESIRMSQSVDKTGERTLAVVTKVDKAPEGLLEKVTADDVNIGLGYVCVRNRIGDETYEEARAIAHQLFETHPLLSKIDKSIVGIPVLAQKLVQIQATSIARNLPEIVKKINDRLNDCLNELNQMPRSLSSVAEAMTAFMQIIGCAKESLRKVLLRGEFDEYADDKKMHCTAPLVEMLNQYSDDLYRCVESDPKINFLMDEIKILEEAKGIALPNFLPRNAFLIILQSKVKGISSIPIGFVDQVWSYIEDVVISVLMKQSENYYQLQLSARRAGHNLMAKMKDRSIRWMMEIVEMEKLTDYTCDPEYVAEWNKLMAQQESFMNGVLHDENRPSTVAIEGIGEVEVAVLRHYPHQLAQAFDLKMRMTAYWKVVLRRFVDCMALHLQLSVSNLVNKEMEVEIVNELMGPYGGGIERMLEESPAVAVKREKLNKTSSLPPPPSPTPSISTVTVTITIDLHLHHHNHHLTIDLRLHLAPSPSSPNPAGLLDRLLGGAGDDGARSGEEGDVTEEMEEGVKGEQNKVFPHASVLFSRAKLPIWKRALPPRPQPANFRNRASLSFRCASASEARNVTTFTLPCFLVAYTLNRTYAINS
ncbi:hypothetical protein ACLB2K_033588 [Fragaria x ananassa]